MLLGKDKKVPKKEIQDGILKVTRKSSFMKNYITINVKLRIGLIKIENNSLLRCII